MTTSAPIRTGELEPWVEQRGDGPDALLIAGLGDPAEAWQFQLDGGFEVVPGQAHQPFQEIPTKFNARVDAFWREVDAAE